MVGYSRDSSVNRTIIDKTFTCNDNSRRIFIDKFERRESEVETVYIGVDENKFNPDIFNKQKILRELQIQKNKKVISFICRITDQKRPFLFFEIIKSLTQQRDDIIAVIAGDGPMLEDLKNKVKQERLQNFFVFLGNYEETEKIYKISDITVNTSIKEGIALTSYESLSMGVPVVSADVGGQAELIKNSVGTIVPCFQKEEEILNFNYSSKEIENYVSAINEVLNNLDFYKLNCRKRILNGFTNENMIKKMEQEFIKIAENPSQEKKQNGLNLAKNIDILKELIITYIVSSKSEYEWLVENFNRENVHKISFDKEKTIFYEHTIEYKLKHPIVVALRKIGVYERFKEILGL